MTLRCVYPHLQSSTHFQQRTPYLTSEPSVSDRPFSPKILLPPCWCSLLSQLKIWQLFHMALESTLKYLAWSIRPCAICHLRLCSFISQPAPCHTLSCRGAAEHLAIPWRNHAGSHLFPLSIFPPPCLNLRAASPSWRVISELPSWESFASWPYPSSKFLLHLSDIKTSTGTPHPLGSVWFEGYFE